MNKKYDDNGLYFDGHDITNAFMWGAVVGAFIATLIMACFLHSL